MSTIQQLVINKLNDPAFLRRAAGGSHYGAGLDGKRPRAWCEYGYPENLTASDYYNFWSRTGVGRGAVRVLTDKCWETNPTTDSKTFDSLASELHLWNAIRQADIYRLAGPGWSAMLINVAGEQLDRPVTRSGGTKALVELQPIWSTAIQSTAQAGKIIKHTLTAADGSTFEVHPDRLIIVGSAADEPFLKAGFNDGVDIEKILGGSGESSLKNAARQLHVNFDMEAELGDLIKKTNADEVTVRQALNEVAFEMNRGNDAVLTTQGANVQMLTAAVSDPTGNFNASCASFAASVGLPIRTIIGNQTGERASTEDNKALAARAQARRINELSRDLGRIMRALYNAGVTQQLVRCTWDDLTAETLSERIKAYGELVGALAAGAAMLTPEQNEAALKITGLDRVING